MSIMIIDLHPIPFPRNLPLNLCTMLLNNHLISELNWLVSNFITTFIIRTTHSLCFFVGCGRIKLTVPFILKLQHVDLVTDVAGSISTPISPAPFSSKTCTMVLDLLGNKMKALRSVRLPPYPIPISETESILFIHISSVPLTL